MKMIAQNRKAKHDYQILEVYETGIALRGMEVKSLRSKGCSIEESFARVEGSEVFLYNMHIPDFEKASYFKSDPKRIRKLLLHKKEIKKLIGATTQRGLALIPLRIFFNERGWAKMEIALAKGRKLYEKRKKIKDQIAEDEAKRAMRKFYRKSR